MWVKTLTLAPPIARRVGRFAPALYGPLAAVPPLRSHALYVMRRPGQVDTFRPRGVSEQ
jgi:hypothetical protein